MRVLSLLALCCLLIPCVVSFYLPGVAPTDYADGQPVKLKVNKLDSVRTQLPYGYYTLDFCRPDTIVDDAENLGEILSGDLIENSMYELHMKVDETCRILCKRSHTKAHLKKFAERIEEEYRVNWIVDNLPAATKYLYRSENSDSPDDFIQHYEKGFALGFEGSNEFPNSKEGVYYLNNHVRISLFYHEDPQSYEGKRIVGFEVEPFSVAHRVDGKWNEEDSTQTKLATCSATKPVTLDMTHQPVSGDGLKDQTEIIYTYDVIWTLREDLKWASRWDLYLKMTDSRIHWFSIVNSTMIVLFLTGMIAIIMLRTLHRDFRRYNQAFENPEEAQQEETGWKLIYADVFRPPQYGTILSMFVGTGVQVLAMTLLLLFFAVLGLLSPSNRGGLMTALLFFFIFMSVFNGYFTIRTYKMFRLTEWKKVTFYTSMMFPSVCFGSFFFFNLLVWGEKSSGAVPFLTLVFLVILWFGISVPLCYFGSYFAFKKPADEFPCRVNNIERIIPPQAWYMQSHFSVLIGGILPFGAVFIEIFFIMSSVWLHQFYYAFGILVIVFIILLITCAEITIVMCYFQLCGEDHQWWWRSFLTSGSSALYLFLYTILYFFTKLEIVSVVSSTLYFGYMMLVSFAFFCLTGTIGYFACLFFVKKIYSSIKVE